MSKFFETMIIFTGPTTKHEGEEKGNMVLCRSQARGKGLEAEIEVEGWNTAIMQNRTDVLMIFPISYYYSQSCPSASFKLLRGNNDLKAIVICLVNGSNRWIVLANVI